MSDENPFQDKATTQWKKLIVCCDGTGQSSSSGKPKVPTNVFRFSQALTPSTYVAAEEADDTGIEHHCAYEIPQIVLYQTGIGADDVSGASNAIAQTFGAGIDTHILEAYTFIANNFEKGDEIYLFGFSRGAFTARAIGSLICNAGLLMKHDLEFLPLIYNEYKKRRDTNEARATFDKFMNDRKQAGHFKLHEGVIITIMGLWDTVGSLGIPETGLSNVMRWTGVRDKWNESYGYHDTSLPTKKDGDDYKAWIVNVYQALALEETRTSFGPTLLCLPSEKKPKTGVNGEEEGNANNDGGFMQCWFPGIHTDVGGGYERAYRDISDLSLMWMIGLCNSHLTFRDDIHKSLEKTTLKVVDPALPPPKDRKIPKDLGWGLSEIHDEYHTPKFLLGGATTRKPGQYYLDKESKDVKRYRTEEWIHPSVRLRMMQKEIHDKPWRPDALKGFQLSKEEEEESMYTGHWKWTKKVDGHDDVVIYEHQLSYEEAELLTPEAKALYDDVENASLAVNKPLPAEGWVQWGKKIISSPFS